MGELPIRRTDAAARSRQIDALMQESRELVARSREIARQRGAEQERLRVLLARMTGTQF